MTFTHIAEVCLFLSDLLVAEELLTRSLHTYQCVGSDELGFQIGKRTYPKIFQVWIHLLVHNQRDEKAELADLDRNRLDIYAINTVFDKVELAAIVELISGK